MSVGKISKGATLIEAIIAVFILSITITATARVITSSGISRKVMEDTMEAVYTVDAVKKLILCNYTYEDIERAFTDKEVFLNIGALNGFSLEEIQLLSCIEGGRNTYPAIGLKGTKGEGGTLKINLTYYYKGGNFMESVFYRGNYEQVQ